MKHLSSQGLYHHWNEKRSHRSLPERSDIDPSGFRSALADTFVLSLDAQGGHSFRLAGTRVCALFGMELKDSSFLQLWCEHDRAAVERLMTTAADDSIGVVAAVTGHCHDQADLDLELLLLPLRHCGQTHLRLIGSLGPLTAPMWLGSVALNGLTLGDYRYLGHRTETTPALVPDPPKEPVRSQHGFIVYEGGRS
jgi:hypothetical protein